MNTTERYEVSIAVPSSSANVGLGYDVWCLGLNRPWLKTTLIRDPDDIGVEVKVQSPVLPPEGRFLGYAGRKALEHFVQQFGIKEGLLISYEDDGYPVGGLGRSGAESVGAIVAAAALYNIPLSREEIISLSAKGEPGEHMDNVAASTNGGFNIIARSPASDQFSIDTYNPPDNLGIAIGLSSHQKTTGTEGMREVLKGAVPAEDFVIQSGLITAATAALISGNTNRFLELVWGDRFHEPRRADIGGYGNFSAMEFLELKRKLFHELHIALNVSGAGPNMQFLYNRDEYKNGIHEAVLPAIGWFYQRRILLDIADLRVAVGGAYDHAMGVYGYPEVERSR